MDKDFDWIKEIKANPWELYDLILFDDEPTFEEFNDLVDAALNTRKLSNKDAWDTDRRDDYHNLIDYIESELIDGNRAALGADRGLSYGKESHFWETKKERTILFSKIKGKYINESNDWDWIKSESINPWHIADGFIFLNPPTEKELITLIEKALSTHKITNSTTWSPRNIDSAIYYALELWDDNKVLILFIDNESYLLISTDVTEIEDDVKLVNWEKVNNLINESNDWDWVREINPEIKLQKGTCYYFEPPLTNSELHEFVSRVHNIDIKFTVTKSSSKDGKLGINYFAVDDSGKIGGWCNETAWEDAQSYYERHYNIVDARKEFGL